jgi:hypothetical protein
VLWFLVALGASLSGVLAQVRRSEPPTLLALAIGAPIVVFLLWYAGSVALRRFLLSLDVGRLVGVQLYRVIGGVFLVLYYQHTLPGSFALPAGLGDVLAGVTAPVLAMAMSSNHPLSRRLVVLWCIFGITDLVAAITLGILSSRSSLGLLAGDVTTAPMSTFPLSLIPTYLVPVSVILHLITLRRVLRSVNDRSTHLDLPRAASAR